MRLRFTHMCKIILNIKWFLSNITLKVSVYRPDTFVNAKKYFRPSKWFSDSPQNVALRVFGKPKFSWFCNNFWKETRSAFRNWICETLFHCSHKILQLICNSYATNVWSLLLYKSIKKNWDMRRPPPVKANNVSHANSENFLILLKIVWLKLYSILEWKVILI